MSKRKYTKKNHDGFIGLSAAIVKQAIDDYRWKSYKHDVESFIYGEWFGRLSTLDPDYVMERIKRKYGR